MHSSAKNTLYRFASPVSLSMGRHPFTQLTTGRHCFSRLAEQHRFSQPPIRQTIGFQLTEDGERNSRRLPVNEIQKTAIPAKNLQDPSKNNQGSNDIYENEENNRKINQEVNPLAGTAIQKTEPQTAHTRETSCPPDALRQQYSLREAYEPHIPLKDRYCLHKLEREWAKQQPLKGKRVLLNMHLTRFTLALIHVLLKAGARLEITVSPPLVTHQNALQPLLAANIPVLSTVPDEKKNYYYDLVYDCGAGMRHIVPKTGMAELTHTSPAIYHGMSFPIITVDLSQTKVIETGLGTGDSFVRLIHSLAQQSIALLALHCNKGLEEELPHQRLYFTLLSNLIQIDALFSHNRFMIFGFGKVGKGIASALESAGTPKKNIFVVDVSPNAYMGAIKQGYCGLLLNSQAPKSLENIKKILPEIWAVVTATGVKGAISQHFSQSDFDHVALLANMSTDDDFGPRFTTHRILNHKKPANFMLDYPTEVMYLDATFALFLKAGEELLTNKKLKHGLNAIPPAIDQALLADWLAQHGDGIWRHRLERLQTEQRIQHLRQHLAMQPSQEKASGLKSSGLFHYPAESKLPLDSPPAPHDSTAKPNPCLNSPLASLRHH